MTALTYSMVLINDLVGPLQFSTHALIDFTIYFTAASKPSHLLRFISVLLSTNADGLSDV